MKVFDKGAVELISHSGGDISVVAAARVSNGATYSEASKGEESDRKLINYLMKHKHGTPFEHNLFTFYLKVPLFVAREHQRHRVGSFNEISGRYVEFQPEFYQPDALRIPAATNKQGSVFPEECPVEGMALEDWHWYLKTRMRDHATASYLLYKELLAKGVAKEMARMVLPVSLFTEYYWTVNARSLMNFLSLRTSSDAQFEIAVYAGCMKILFEEAMPLTAQAFEANGRIAP